MKIYGDGRSGNCYKLQLICALLDIEYQWQEIDILAGDTQQSWFRKKNPLGKIPLLECEDGRLLSESNAILNYLAAGSAYYPDTPFATAKVQQWQFFEQYSHEPYIAVARFIQHYLDLPESRMSEYRAKQEGGHKALAYMNAHLESHIFLVDERPTTADIALFAYTHVAHQGGFSLQDYPAVSAWIKRIEQLPKFVPMSS